MIEGDADEAARREMLSVRAEHAPVFGCRDDLFRRVTIDKEHGGARSSCRRWPIDVEREHAIAVRPVHQIAPDSGGARRWENGRRGKVVGVTCHQAFAPWYLPLHPPAVALG